MACCILTYPSEYRKSSSSHDVQVVTCMSMMYNSAWFLIWMIWWHVSHMKWIFEGWEVPRSIGEMGIGSYVDAQKCSFTWAEGTGFDWNWWCMECNKGSNSWVSLRISFCLLIYKYAYICLVLETTIKHSLFSQFLVWFQNFDYTLSLSALLVVISISSFPAHSPHTFTFFMLSFSFDMCCIQVIVFYCNFSSSSARVMLYLSVDKIWQELLSWSLHGLRYVQRLKTSILLTWMSPFRLCMCKCQVMIMLFLLGKFESEKLFIRMLSEHLCCVFCFVN